MRRLLSPRIVYVGRAISAAEAFPCSSCYAEIGRPCVWNQHTGPIPHRCRVEYAEAVGLRDVAAASLFPSLALPGDAVPAGARTMSVSPSNSAGVRSDADPALLGDRA